MRRPHAPTPMPGLQCPGPPRVLRAPTSRAGPREALGLHLFSHFQPSLSPSSFLDPRASGSLTKPAPWPHWVWAALLSQLLCLGLSPLPWVSVSSLWVYLHPLGSDSDLTLSLVSVSISAPSLSQSGSRTQSQMSQPFCHCCSGTQSWQCLLFPPGWGTCSDICSAVCSLGPTKCSDNSCGLNSGQSSIPRR